MFRSQGTKLRFPVLFSTRSFYVYDVGLDGRYRATRDVFHATAIFLRDMYVLWNLFLFFRAPDCSLMCL